jgi:uncharacterized protein YbaP (TraB family)
MMRLATTFATLALAWLATGCASTHRLADRTHLPKHPIHETRMTNQPTDGYVPTGVWRIRGPQNTVYLVGTCHLVDDNEIPFPSAFYAAYQDSKDIYVEYDSLSFSGQWMIVRAVPGMVRWVMAHQSELSYPKGQTLTNHLSAETVTRLRAFYGREFRQKERMTPLALVFWNEFLSTQGGDTGGADDLFTLLAHRDDKRIRSLDDGTVVDLIKPTLDVILASYTRKITERGADAVIKEEILDHQEETLDWRYGDVRVAEKEVAEMKKDAPALYEKLLPGRNRQWLPKITQALQGQRNTMVLVGAMHLVGDDGLLQLLRNAGFKSEQMYGIDRPKLGESTSPAKVRGR